MTSNDIAIPTELTLLCRCLVTLEGTLEKISPTSNLIEILINHKRNTVLKDLDYKDQGLKIGQNLYKTLKKSYALPQIVYDLIKMSKNGQLHVNVTESDDYNRTTYQKKQFSIIIKTVFSCMCMLCGVLTESYYMSIVLFTISMLLGIDVFFHLRKLKR